ncbi:MAG: oligopeptide transporter, OPT family [Acidobacteria bacterium]|nr:oligopeptide transporter, OPT family [Acidobacteriota bacterium]
MSRGLSRKAYEPLAEGEKYEPWVPATEGPLEFTFRSILLGIIFGILFGAANAFLGLKSGLTISTSIPVAVMTVAAFRAFSRVREGSSILEANMAQTIGSASSSVASGVIFTLPALFLWGMDPSIAQMTLLAMSGGLIGVLFMIPLRQYLIAREHGKLPYPEGTACAEVLVASEGGGARAASVFWGLGIGALFRLLTGWVKLVPGEVEFGVPGLRKGEISSEVSAPLFGVGYILGPRIASVMVGGGLLSALIIIPAIAYWGAGRTTPLYPETVLTITEMSPGAIWTRYIRYIGAGAVAMAGLITLAKSIPTMIESFRVGASQIRNRLGSDDVQVERTSRDLPLKVVGIGISLVALALIVIPAYGVFTGALPRAIATILVVIFAFFFVTVSSRIVGFVGVTSNPTSGMTIASLLGTSAIFLMMGWTDSVGMAGALTVGCVVAIAASIAGDTSQDLKTGFILGATPARQQIGELVGVITSAAFVCGAVILLDRGIGFGTEELSAPQATLMKLVIEGVLQQSLPWVLVGIGAAIAIIVELLRIPSLPFAVGVYLPLATMFPVFLGGLLRWFAERGARDGVEKDARREQGILFGSGLVGGAGLTGVLIAGAAVWSISRGGQPWGGLGIEYTHIAGNLTGLVTFAILVGIFWWIATRKLAAPEEPPKSAGVDGV